MTTTRPRSFVRALLTVVVTTAVALALLSAPGAGDRTPRAQAATAAAADAYRPSGGVTFNNPLGGDQARHRINNKIANAINHARYPATINVVSWNFNSNRFVGALTRAYERGVTVRLLMQGNMARQQGRDKSFWRLRRNLNATPDRRGVGDSWARTCENSCRGRGGIMHSKFYLFNRTGAARHVVMNGSGNLTDAAAVIQWNDLFTTVGNKRSHEVFTKIFWEMTRDRNARPAFRDYRVNDSMRAIFYPYQGNNTKSSEPLLDRLRDIRCRGARNTHNGRTQIYIAQTAWLDWRGEQVARRVKRLWNDGCHVRVAWAVSRDRVMNILRGRGGRGPVPMRHIVQDWDGDLVYDRYLHMKSLTIIGRRGANRDYWMTWNGSQNWTKVAKNSDEAEFRTSSRYIARRYRDWVNFLFNNPPRSARARVAWSPDIDRYAKVEIH